MKRVLKGLTARLAASEPARILVEHLVYPALIRRIVEEIRPDGASPSGVAEALAWKVHSYIVFEKELRTTGENCSGPRMRHDEETREHFFDVLAKANAPDGDILEFGVFQGKSLRLFAARFPLRRIYGFDSFEGLPEDWWNRPQGTFKTDMPRIDEARVRLVRGRFDETLPGFLEEWSGKAAIIHIDCTLYTSTMACLPLVLSRSQQGTIVIFDEYYNYPDFAQHEWRAWRELRRRYRLTAPCIAYDARRVAFQIADLGDLVPKSSSAY